MICRLCLEEKNLIKAHIIPRAFFPRTNSPMEMTKVYGTHLEHSKKLPSGFYDTQILCQDCERRFNNCDDHAIKVLKHGNFVPKRVIGPDNVLYFENSDFNYAKLKMFFIGLLWRAIVSEQYYYSRIKLADHEPILREFVIRNDAPNDIGLYGVLICKYTNTSSFENISDFHFMPLISTKSGIQYVEFRFGGFVFFINVTGVDPVLYEYLLSPMYPLTAIGYGIKEGWEFPEAIRMILESKK